MFVTLLGSMLLDFSVSAFVSGFVLIASDYYVDGLLVKWSWFWLVVV